MKSRFKNLAFTTKLQRLITELTVKIEDKERELKDLGNRKDAAELTLDTEALFEKVADPK